jgi:hypothetical protein
MRGLRLTDGENHRSIVWEGFPLCEPLRCRLVFLRRLKKSLVGVWLLGDVTARRAEIQDRRGEQHNVRIVIVG